jgi:hypothetical protein
VVALLLVMGAVGSAEWLSHYQPLGPGSGGYGVSPVRDVTDSFDAQGPDTSFIQYQVRWQDGKSVRVMFPLWNHGRIPVVVTGLAKEDFGSIRASLARTRSNGQDRTRPFAPFTLAPGEGIQLFVDVEMRPVLTGTSIFLTEVDLAYKVGWYARSANVWMGMTLELCDPRCRR